MQILKPHQLLLVFMAGTAGTLVIYLMFNIFQALCFGIVVGIFAYALLLSLEDKKSSDVKFPDIKSADIKPQDIKPQDIKPPDIKL